MRELKKGFQMQIQIKIALCENVLMLSGFDLILNKIHYCHADKRANFRLKRESGGGKTGR